MSSNVTISVKVNFNKLPQLPGRVREGASQVIRKCALSIEADAKSACPVDSGTLVNSISTEAEAGGLEATVSTDSGYGAYVNFGTRKMAPRPFMSSAVANNTGKLQADMQAMIRGL